MEAPPESQPVESIIIEAIGRIRRDLGASEESAFSDMLDLMSFLNLDYLP